MTDLHTGDCLAVMPTLEASSIDTIITDPPYGLEFMGKDWDHGVPGVAFWVEALRVAKPGATLLAFGGTRTVHRLACAIEDAGWEIFDRIMWVYGSGFPKSHDISKAIDKAGYDPLAWRSFSTAYAAAVESSSFAHSDIDRALGIKSSSCYWARTDHRGGMPPRHHWERVVDMLDLPEEFVELYEEAEREVVGRGKRNGAPPQPMWGDDDGQEWAITAPATPAAELWHGWGTALKPAYEPIICARKPNDGTYANNALQHGVAGLWIDGARVGMRHANESGWSQSGNKASENRAMSGAKANYERPPKDEAGRGRWPANLIHDGSEEVVSLFPESGGDSANRKPRVQGHGSSIFGVSTNGHETAGFADTGSAARFFYTAKASKAERDAGLEGMRNGHPTVKPLALMRYLCRLTKTPTGGTVLDPFMGSGSTGCAAVLEGREFIGIEASEEYTEMARRRIAHWQGVADAEAAKPKQLTLL